MNTMWHNLYRITFEPSFEHVGTVNQRLAHVIAERAHAALLLRAALFAVLAAAPLPTAALVPVAALAGAVAAGTPGSLRTLLARLAAEEGPVLRRALSLDTVLLELAWTAAPAVVAALATGNPRLALGGLAASTVLAGLIGLHLPVPRGGATPSSQSTLRSLRPAAMSLLLGLCGGLVGGVLDTAVPPRLVDIGAPAALGGVLFTGYSITSVLAGLVYGAPGGGRALLIARRNSCCAVKCSSCYPQRWCQTYPRSHSRSSALEPAPLRS